MSNIFILSPPPNIGLITTEQTKKLKMLLTRMGVVFSISKFREPVQAAGISY